MDNRIPLLLLAAGLVLVGFMAYAQDASDPVQESIDDGMAFLQSQDGLDVSESLILVGILDHEYSELGIRNWVLEKEPLLDKKHTFWHAWLRGEEVDLDELSEFEQELPFNLDLARALQCETVSSEKIQELTDWKDDSEEEFGSYNNEQAFLLSYFYSRCDENETVKEELDTLLSTKLVDIQDESFSNSLTETLLHYCLMGLAGLPLTETDVEVILSFQQDDGGWTSLADLSRTNTFPYPTSLAVCALLKFQDNQGIGSENEVVVEPEEPVQAAESLPIEVPVENEEGVDAR
ncbi:MAG: hypothetical protein AABW68_04735 [archaeon]